MSGRIRTAALASVLTIAGGLLLDARPAQAQGAPNTYADFPFNQGSLFYKPLPPKPRPKRKVVQAPAMPRMVRPAQGYSTVQPYAAPVTPQPRYYYYYPAYPR